jgi:rod shape-determining protein MreC
MSKTGYDRPQIRRHFWRYVLAVSFTILSVMFLADAQQKSLLKSGRRTADDTSVIILGAIASPVRGIGRMGRAIQGAFNAGEKNTELQAEVARLREYEFLVHDLELRVRHFEDILNMDYTGIPEQRIVARAVTETHGPFVHSTLIKAGVDKDVKKGQAVMTSEGLYGHVVRVGRVSARVLLLNDLNSRVSVMSQRSESRAIMVGANASRPKLDYVSLDADWQVGDSVMTSGDGGVLPRGLPVGIVVAAKGKSLGVELLAGKSAVNWVSIISFNPIVPPEEDAAPVVEEPVSPKQIPAERALATNGTDQ